ncbi:MAG: hypothetical protein U0271_01925 [Polyangiaceae bacterium]
MNAGRPRAPRPHREAVPRPIPPPINEDVGRTAALARKVAIRAARSFPLRPIDELLAEHLAGNELTTLLMHAFRERARRRTFAHVLEQAEKLLMTHPSQASARRLHAFDGVAFGCARDFEALDLAPVEPLGLAPCTGVDANNVLATLRFGEVAADPSTALALAAARRKRAGRGNTKIRLCTSQRVLRLQPWEQPGFSPHFRLFALGTFVRSARAREDDATERHALREQIAVFCEMFDALPAAEFAPTTLRIVVSDTRLVAAALGKRGLDVEGLARRATSNRPSVAAELLAKVDGVPRASEDPARDAAALGLGPAEQGLAAALHDDLASLRTRAPLTFDFARLQGANYYRGPYVQLVARRADGFELPIGDGGAVPWMEELLSDHRERMVSTGLGSEIFVKLFDSNHRDDADELQ